MIYTTNLELPVVEDSDNVLNSLTQANEISNKVEEKLGSYDDTVSALTTLTGTVTNINSDYSSFKTTTNNSISSINTNLDTINENIDVITFIDTDGVQKRGKVKSAILNNIDYTASQTIAYMPKYDGTSYPQVIESDKRVAIASSFINASLNLTTLLGLTDVEKIRILDFNAYDDNPSIINRGNLPKLNVRQIGVDGANLYLRCTGDSTSMVVQTYQNNMWVGGNFPPIDTTVNLDVAITYLEILED